MTGGRARASLTDEAIARLKGMITAGELCPGDRLPREADLAERLGLSRTSLREAIKALSLIRVLDVRQGDGTYVTSLQPELLGEAITFVLDFHRDDSALQFLEARRVVEPALVALAAQRATDTDIVELSELHSRMHTGMPPAELVELDMAFHRRLVAATGNPALVSLADSLAAPTTRARVWRGLTDTGGVARTLAEHGAILDAVRRRAPDLAAACAAVHVAGVEAWLRHALG